MLPAASALVSVSVLESQDFPALFLLLHPCNHCTNTGLFYLLLTSLPALLLPYKSSMDCAFHRRCKYPMFPVLFHQSRFQVQSPLNLYNYKMPARQSFVSGPELPPSQVMYSTKMYIPVWRSSISNPVIR